MKDGNRLDEKRQTRDGVKIKPNSDVDKLPNTC